MVVDSDIELFCSKSDILFMAFLTSYEVNEVAGSTAEVVSDCECGSAFRGGEVFTAVQVLAGDTSRVVAAFYPCILYTELW